MKEGLLIPRLHETETSKQAETLLRSIPQDKLNMTTVKYLIYLLYKSNMLARNNLREMLKIIVEDNTINFAEYLVTESKR